MATKIWCAAIDCAYHRDDNRCTAKEINLSDHSIMTVHDGRQRFQRCKAFQKSEEAAEMEIKFMEMFARAMEKKERE